MRDLASLAMLALDTLVIIVMLGFLATCYLADADWGSDFWQYYEPVRQNMPQNCSNDVQRVIKLWDKVISSGNEKAYNELKALFGLSEVIHAVDVVNTCRSYSWIVTT